jgi:hypothetical protein
MAEGGAFARRAPVRTASEDRRTRIAALVMATSDAAAEVTRTRDRRSRVPVAVFSVAAAAAVAVFVWRARLEPAQYAIAWPVLPVAQVAHANTPAVARETAPLVAHESTPTAATVSTPASPVKPRSATPSSHVFAGSEERGQDAGMTRDQVTLPPPPAVPVTAFQRGWIALRGAHYAEAIAAFDQATEPTVAEDAAYWAAIASARAGDRADAARRMTAFVAKFPGSTRISDARTLLARLAP